MEEFVSRIATNVGVDPALADKAVGMMLGFLQREAADGPAARMIEAIPGASELVAKHDGEDAESGSVLAGGGVVGFGQQLMNEGLSLGNIAGLANETIAFAKEHAGDELVDEVLNSVPGLPQFA
ncbi:MULTISPECIES: hypothetical protein [Mesorhizobium]|uniref:hypothetical protein n=1 Tax=Mesorhizobium TaxID=68287 RepID=UPI0007EDAC03|nr:MULTISPECIES: hypothetical protein [Mesorhizobium]PBB52351.1 hypothetical protein CK223_30115 [Mesorhizobium loti]QIA25415.1 hypothetical protein A9K68_029530 [Mesorhizobium sp. AA22]